MDIGNEFGMVETFLPFHIIMIRVAIAVLLGAIIGYERQVHTAGAGFRTHILISAASALFTILAFEIYHTIEVVMESGDMGSQADPIRAVEAVTAGIAFLGAGAIFRSGGSVQGITTGAGMWLAGAVGIAAAMGFYLIAFSVTLLAAIVLALLRSISHRLIRKRLDPEEAEEVGRQEASAESRPG